MDDGWPVSINSGFASDAQRKAFFGIKAEHGERSDKPTFTMPEIHQKSSEIDIHKAFKSVKEGGTTDHAKQFLDDDGSYQG